MNYDHYNYYDDEQEEQESEMLIQEIDPDYEPTNQEIKMYAISTLGMNLPEDKDFLYLAREALKAPLPDNWNAFENRQGEVYYKHRITQQITIQHPIDIEYRRRYQQEKEKVARRNLKSMASKPSLSNNNNPSGISKLKLLSNIARQEELSGNIEKIENVSGVDFSEISQKYDRQIQRMQKEMQNIYQQFKISNEQQFKQKQKQLQIQHEAQLRRIKHNHSTGISLEDRISQQISKIKKELQEHYRQQYELSLREIQESYKKNIISYQKDLQQSLKNKLMQIEYKNQEKISAKESVIQKLQKLIEDQQSENQAQAIQEFKNAQKEFQRRKIDYDRDVELKIKSQFQVLFRTRQENVKKRQLELQGQYIKIKKLLKNSPQDQILDFIDKKSKLKELSQKKFLMHKLRQIQAIDKQMDEMYNKLKIQKQEVLEKQNKILFEKKTQETEKEFLDNLNLLKSNIQVRIQRMQKDIYDKFIEKLSTYEIKKNKEFIDIREKFIYEIQTKKSIMDSDNNISSAKLILNQKEFHITNQEKQIITLKRQIKLLEENLFKYQLDRKIFKYTSEEITNFLKEKLGQPKNNYLENMKKDPCQLSKSENLPLIFREYQLKLIEMKNNLSQDKAILKKVMQFLQDNASVPFYQRRKILNSNLLPSNQQQRLYSIGVSHADLIKKYNKDIRICRQNEKIIFKLQNLLEKARNYELQALQELKASDFRYKKPQLSQNLHYQKTQSTKMINTTTKVTDHYDHPTYMSGHLNSTKKVQEMFKQHSRFLVNVKNELNSRLAQIRGMSSISRVF